MQQKKTTAEPVRKPFITGKPLDEYTPKNSLIFFGCLLIVIFISFITCATASFSNLILRLVMNLAVISVTLLIFYNSGSGKGSEAVSRGEILYQKQIKGKTFSESERSVCFHHLKGYLTGLFGTLPLLVLAVLLAVNTTVILTDSGALPSWMQNYVRRDDIGNALVNYTLPEGLGFTDYLRAALRICILPFVNLVGQGNKQGLLTLERLSPVIVLLPALSYGTGYLTGRKIRTKIHTTISANDQKRIRMEKKARKARAARQAPREPEQLN